MGGRGSNSPKKSSVGTKTKVSTRSKTNALPSAGSAFRKSPKGKLLSKASPNSYAGQLYKYGSITGKMYGGRKEYLRDAIKRAKRGEE